MGSIDENNNNMKPCRLQPPNSFPPPPYAPERKRGMPTYMYRLRDLAVAYSHSLVSSGRGGDGRQGGIRRRMWPGSVFLPVLNSILL